MRAEAPGGERDDMKTLLLTALLALAVCGLPASALAADAATDSESAKAVQEPQLVEGAPLGNANVHVHAVQRAPYLNEGKHELVLYPAVLQINGKFTQHYGLGLMYAYHVFEKLAVQVTPIWNYWNKESDFNQELIDKGHVQAKAATALLLQYGGIAGVEVSPVYGKFAFYEGILGHFALVINAGAGLGSTRVQLGPDSFGDAGLKFVGSVGAGFRVFLGERMALRLEVRDLIYSARVDRINGCSHDDLGDSPASVSGGCSPQSFSDFDRTQARMLLQENSSDVINNVSFYAGFSFLF